MFELGLIIFLFSCGMLLILCLLLVIYTSVHTYILSKEELDNE